MRTRPSDRATAECIHRGWSILISGGALVRMGVWICTDVAPKLWVRKPAVNGMPRIAQISRSICQLAAAVSCVSGLFGVELTFGQRFIFEVSLVGFETGLSTE